MATAKSKTDIKENVVENTVEDTIEETVEETVTIATAKLESLMARINALEEQGKVYEQALASKPEIRAKNKAAEKKVKLRIPPGRSQYERQPLFVAANGKGMRIPRGVEVEVPESIANAYYDSVDQSMAAADITDKMAAKSTEF
jgi:hypothetical protein